MIRNFGDHAANERTFLAWIRTAIAVLAFGFVIERFDLVLVAAGLTRDAGTSPVQERALANIAGTFSIGLGTLMFVLATVRFLRNANLIDNEDQLSVPSSRVEIVLGGLLSVLGMAMLVYLSNVHKIG